MKLYLLRHGKAEEQSSSGIDADRRLTDEGIAEMKAEADGLKALKLQFDLIISSPYPRALETAEIVARALGLPDDSIIQASELAAGNFGVGGLQNLLEKHATDRQVDKLLVVGHEPDFSTVIRLLTGANVEMKKGGFAFVELDEVIPNGGILRWLLTPRHLMRG